LAVPELEFCVLGPLLVRSGGVAVPVTQARPRAVLAALLLSAGRPVPADDLAEVLWGPGRPPSAAVSLRNYVMRLRRCLGQGGAGRIRTQPPGYLIDVGPGELDLARFEELLGSARAAARCGSWEAAAGHAGAALGIWRGEPLADVDCDALALREVPRLTELRLQAVEISADARLRLGRYAEVVGELERVAAAHPLRERLSGLLMAGLDGDGRRADALAVYQDVRRVLVSELGLEPGAELRELQQRILTGDAATGRPPAVAGGTPAVVTAGGHARVVPRELPGVVRGFVGRDGELSALSALLEQAADAVRGAVVISAIGGTAGVGKTALAVQWAHRVAGRFPDGQLYVNLAGYGPREPVPAAEALAGLLHSLGVPRHEIPADTDERAARYRSLLAGRRMLIVLDNAREAGQVRPLLPGTRGCMTVVTSRDSLAGLVARDGAVRMDLDLLPPADAMALLRMLIGGRATAEPAATQALARACCRLPLALRVAAELAAARPRVPLGDLVTELADQRRRLDLLDAGGDQVTSLRAVFSWSYQHLDAAAARAFRLAGLHPSPDFDRYAAAALTGCTADTAGQMLGALARAHLIQPAGTGRYSMHDLLRGYARELAEATDAEHQRRAAVTRLLDYYLQAACAATDMAFPAGRHRRPRARPHGTQACVPPMASEDAARGWLDAELPCMIAAAAHAAGAGLPGHTTRLSAILAGYLDTNGRFTEARALHQHAAQAGRRLGDPAAEADAVMALGNVGWQQGRYREALASYERALALSRQAGYESGQARALNFLGSTALRMGQHPDAASSFEQALALFRSAGESSGAAYALSNLGVCNLRLGRHDLAADNQKQALRLFRELGDRHGQAQVFRALGLIDLRRNRYEHAAGSLQRSLALARELGDRMDEAFTLVHLGLTRSRQGDHQEAVSHLHQALAAFRELGARSGQTHALNGLGEVFLAMGRAADARPHHAAALDLATQAGEKREQARAHDGLGNVHEALGDPARARRHRQRALELYAEIGAPEAEQARAKLSLVDQH
jgi:DNA-binding SARP family transcriptional activator/tetratricopeptide (TPR) repeat protein